jgi:hypothetical protein
MKMTERKFSAAVKNLTEERDRIWMNEPEDAKKIKTIQGAYYQYAPFLLHAESETRECVDYLWYIRNLARDTKQNVESLKPVLGAILEAKADKWIRWYKMEKTPALMRQAASALQDVQNREEMVALIDGLSHYIGRFNFWLDSNIPYMAISSVYDWVNYGK